MNPGDEKPLEDLTYHELFWVWNIVSNEAIKLGFITQTVKIAMKIVQVSKDYSKTDEEVNDLIRNSIENVSAIVSEHRMSNPEEDPER